MGIAALKQSALEAIRNAGDVKTLDAVRVRYLGRKGSLTAVLRSLKDLPVAERKRIGPEANALRDELERRISAREAALETSQASRGVPLDVTRPGARVPRGHLHLLSKVDAEVRRIFSSMNFSIVDGPEVETEYYNFDALNIPASHPARDLWDTFWIKHSKLLMRTHVSPTQIRYMERHHPPFQILYPGLTFRYEATDASHEINFYQSEGLVVGEEVTLANFKFVIETFLKQLFAGQQIQFRFRPSYFPFTEPSLEVDIKLRGVWLEVMGAGMVHRRVFDAVRYNPDQVQGFAFGMGLDRLAMIKYQIPDIRLFYSGDLRFIHQF